MMLVFTAPVIMHICAWDLSYRIIYAVPAEAWDGTPMQGWEPPTLSAYHYVLGALIMLHFVRRFAETLCLHLYSGDMPWSVVGTLAFGYSVDVAFCDYYILNTPQDLDQDTFYGVNVFVWGGFFIWMTGELGCLRHHALLRGLREEAEEQPQKAPTEESVTGSSKKAQRSAARRPNKGNASGTKEDSGEPSAPPESKLGYLSPAQLGGGFELCCCPHYAYEATCWFGLALIARHVFFWGLALQMGLTLCGRARGTMHLYRQWWPSFPKERTAIIPYVF
jgi:hypothetical protein